ncbi:TIGR04282 family arsenosugar biosynthesis glycosyltransferase [Filomicrobium sp.]|uniref:TIGR04282 family arsenosugar biosynthesis glycosyltransferase n=1 Tax=Filomicrobium sp. TaxID=2024831 RepID=UPI002582E78B|nr:TIGR04282 family arsenosugar biosynthesis glycosyltransferase [Filomicrobium sp.]MCV0369110.1 TIGR04282 family arsenosugar biosynthesis glycosyltransferase [Filomicrobium sp.]
MKEESARRSPTAFARHLVVMAKLPVAGRVKTRLARGVGVGRAVSFYRAGLAAALGRVSQARRWTTYVAVAPDSGIYEPVWPISCRRIAQGRGDLGQRMQRVMDGLPPGPVVIIGSDVPEIRSEHIASAFKILASADVVLGPSPDGGYWLVGLRRRPRIARIFDRVRWSHAETLSDTLANAVGLQVCWLEQLDDVDDADDLARLSERAGRRIPSPPNIFS